MNRNTALGDRTNMNDHSHIIDPCIEPSQDELLKPLWLFCFFFQKDDRHTADPIKEERSTSIFNSPSAPMALPIFSWFCPAGCFSANLLTCLAACSETDKPSRIFSRQMANWCRWDILVDGRADRREYSVSVCVCVLLFATYWVPNYLLMMKSFHSIWKLQTFWQVKALWLLG